MKYRFGVLLAATALAACSAGGGGANPAPPLTTSMAVSPSSLSLDQAGQKVTLSVTETNESTGVTLDTSACGKFISSSGTSASGPNAQFTITATAPGTCSLSVSDSNNHTLSVPVVVTVTSGTLQ